MSLVIQEIKTKSEKKLFLTFPNRIYNDNPYWIPPLIFDELKNLDSNLNPAFEFCEVKFWMVFKDGKPMGRIAGIINNEYNKLNNTKIVRFGWMDFFEDIEICKMLINAVEAWGRSKGMKFIQGPLGLTDFDPEGMLVEGFDQLGTMPSIYNHPYYPKFIENLGFQKEADWVEYLLFPPNPPNEKVQRISEVVLKRYNLKILKLKKNKDLLAYTNQLFDVLNEAFDGLYGFVPLNQKQKDYVTKQYLGFANPEFIPIVLDANNKVAAFAITFPSFSEALQKSKGKLFPFGWWYLLKALKKPKRLDLYLIGVRNDMRDKGLNAILMNEINKVCNKYGINQVESNYELEDNFKVQTQWKFYEKQMHKRRRSYIKEI